MATRTTMAFKYLENLTCLQVPDIYFIIFAPADDILSAGGDKTGWYTVRSVGMSCISFYTFGGLIIPESYGGILCRRQNKPGIRRKFDIRTRNSKMR